MKKFLSSLHLDSVPVGQRLRSIPGILVAKDMRVTDNQLFTDTVAYVIDVEAVLFRPEGRE